jgi:AAT family amino acid transporter
MVAVFLGIDEGTRVALYVAPVWFAILGISYRIIQTRAPQPA